MRDRETICPGLYIYEALKYNLLMLLVCLNKVKVCNVKVCMCVRVLEFFFVSVTI